MKRNPSIDHTLGISTLLHIIPGLLTITIYALITPQLRQFGWPSLTGMWTAALLVLVPTELGIPFYLGKQRNNDPSLKKVILNRRRTPSRQFIPLIAVLVLWSVLCFLLLKPIDDLCLAFFSWLPDWFFINEDMSVYSVPVQMINFLGSFFVSALLIPWVEEIYFRGYLLPRLSWIKFWGPIIAAFLFSLYHFWSPWQIFSRFLAVLPLVYIVNWKQDLRIGIAAHWILNAIGILGLLTPLIERIPN